RLVLQLHFSSGRRRAPDEEQVIVSEVLRYGGLLLFERTAPLFRARGGVAHCKRGLPFTYVLPFQHASSVHMHCIGKSVVDSRGFVVVEIGAHDMAFHVLMLGKVEVELSIAVEGCPCKSTQMVKASSGL